MSVLDQFPLLLKRLVTSRHHSGAGGDLSPLRLLRQGLPYYMRRDGTALPPLTIFFVINGRCNLRCRMCDVGQNNTESMFYQNLKGQGGGDFPIERFKSLVDEVQGHRPYLGLTTTEPFLYPHLFEAIGYARGRGLLMNVSSNGVLLERHVDDILDSGLHRLSISLDGPPHIHDSMRGVPGTYERAVRGVRLLAEKKRQRGLTLPHIYLSSFVADANYSHLLEFAEGLPLDDVDRVNVKLMVFTTPHMVDTHNRQWGEFYQATTACLPQDFGGGGLDVDELCRQAAEVRARFGHKITLHFEEDRAKLERYFFRPDEFMDSTRCVIPWFVCQITSNGDLIGLTRCFNVSYGNIMDQPLMQAWNGPGLRRFRQDLQRHGRFPGCARCDGVLYR